MRLEGPCRVLLRTSLHKCMCVYVCVSVCLQARLLVSEGAANLSARNVWGRTALDEARRLGDTNMIAFLEPLTRAALTVGQTHTHRHTHTHTHAEQAMPHEPLIKAALTARHTHACIAR